MRSRHGKRIEILEKRLNATQLKFLKYTEANIEMYISTCQKFQVSYPGAVVFSSSDDDDLQQQGRSWALNLCNVLAYCHVNNLVEFLREVGFEEF